MSEDVTFADLEKLLLRLGFICRQTVGTHQVFQHAASSTLIVLPGYKPQELLRPVHLVSVRKILAENGLITSAAFDGFLEKVNQ
ncbi:type II toxin-antitoxin system HicA family toxin [Phormidesmis sp. 146-33]